MYKTQHGRLPYSLYNSIQQRREQPRPPTAPEDFSVKNDALASPLEGASHYALKSYLALVGKLTLANENDLAAQQLSKDPRDFLKIAQMGWSRLG